jgi:hypothetical protein
MLDIGKERVNGGAADALLQDTEDDLIEEAMG